MAIAKIQSGDKVKVISGNYKGTIGQVLSVISKKYHNGKIIIRASVSTVPKIVKYKRPNKAASVPGMMLETDRLINVSNLSLVYEDDKISKSIIKIDENGKKERFYKKNNQPVIKEKQIESAVKENN